MKITQLKAPIISSVEAMPETRLVWLEAPEVAAAARPGQFVMVRCGQGTILPRPFSVHRVDGGQMALLFSVVGRGTRWLAQKAKGDALDLFGPLGNGFNIDPAAKNLLLVAGGIGIAPLVFLADVAARAGKKGDHHRRGPLVRLPAAGIDAAEAFRRRRHGRQRPCYLRHR